MKMRSQLYLKRVVRGIKQAYWKEAFGSGKRPAGVMIVVFKILEVCGYERRVKLIMWASKG